MAVADHIRFTGHLAFAQNQHRIGPRNRKAQCHECVTVAGQQRQPIAQFDTGMLQPGSQAINHAVKFRISSACIATDDGGAVPVKHGGTAWEYGF